LVLVAVAVFVGAVVDVLVEVEVGGTTVSVGGWSVSVGAVVLVAGGWSLVEDGWMVADCTGAQAESRTATRVRVRRRFFMFGFFCKRWII